eukprot:1857826-Rhodomonas_salina.2
MQRVACLQDSAVTVRVLKVGPGPWGVAEQCQARVRSGDVARGPRQAGSVRLAAVPDPDHRTGEQPPTAKIDTLQFFEAC